MAKSVKLADIAKEFGVSTVTVSKALSGQKGVSEEMREKIIDLANELGYKQPSAVKKENKKSFNIGVLIHEKHFDKYNSFYMQMYQQVSTEAVARECFTLLEIVNQSMADNNVIPKIIQEQRVDGVIFIGKFNDEYLDVLAAYADIPTVYLDFCNEKKDVNAVISDSYYGAYYLTNYLFEMGHSKIAYVGTLLETSSITDRYLGYVKSMMEHGQKIREDWVIEDRDRETGWILEPSKLPMPKELPTAFVCNCDLTASVVIKYLEDKGYSVPEDFSVVGYDNFIFPGVCEVEITSYEVDVKRMAKRAVNRLLKVMNNESHQTGISIVEGHMVIKNSVRRHN